jgi:hypothetical protein
MPIRTDRRHTMPIQFPGLQETIVTVLVIVGVAVALSIAFVVAASLLRRDEPRSATPRRKRSDADTRHHVDRSW